MTLLVWCVLGGVLPAWVVHRSLARGERRRAFTQRAGPWWHPASGRRPAGTVRRMPDPQAFGPHEPPAHEHTFGPAKPCWRAGSYEQHCTVPGCLLVRERRLDHVAPEPGAAPSYQTRSMS